MKICLLTTSYPRHSGDTRGRFIERFVTELRNNGTDVVVISPVSRFFSQFTGKGGILPGLKKRLLLSSIGFLLYSLAFLLAIIRHAGQCDLIHANWGYAGFLALITKPFHAKKIMLTERSSALIATKNPLIRLLLSWTYEHVDCLITISNSSRQELALHHGIAESNIITIPNGVDLPERKSKKALMKEFGLPREKVKIVFVGRLELAKGVMLVLEAASCLNNINALFTLVGDGTQKEKCIEFVRKNDLQNIVFTGEIPIEKVFDYLCASDIFLLPSLNETGGNAVLEGLACGLPVLTTDVGWGKDYIDNGKNGILIAPDAKQIANTIATLIQNKSYCKRLGANARKTIIRERLTWEDCAKKYLSTYKTIAG